MVASPEPLEVVEWPQVKELLGIPADIETVALIPLGYPLGKFGRPPRRPVAEVTFADAWGRAF